MAGEVAPHETGLIPVNPESLIAQAIEKGLPVETMERLLNMRRELKVEWAREQYFAALAAFQAECPVIQKSKVVKDKSGKPRYHYAPLEIIVGQVKDLLNKHGFSYVLDPNQDEKSFTAVCVSHHVDGHSERTSFMVPIDSDAYMSAPQKVGSARTFAMRYAFCDAFGILTGDEDDDARGENGDGNGEERKPPKQEQTSPPKTEGAKADTVFLQQGLLSYLLKVEGIIGKDEESKKKIADLREAIPKHNGDAKWFEDAFMRVRAAVKKSEGEAKEAMLNLEATADATGRTEKATKQGEMPYDHE